MQINYKDESIIINDLKQLKTRHLSQLNIWGFKRINSHKLVLSKNIYSIIPKVIDYFDKYDIKYSVTSSFQNILNNINQNKLKFNQIITLGQNFKNGILDNDIINNHINFLKYQIKRKLKNHQLKASCHLYLVKNGANFSVPGSGKTTVVLSVFERLRIQKKVNALFVIGPPACFAPWRNEYYEVFGEKPNYVILAGGNIIQRKSVYYTSNSVADLYLTTFQTLLNDQDEVIQFFINRNVNIYCVIDEAHYIKKLNGNWANAVLKIAKYSKYRCILTGTPIPKSYSDLYNLFDFLWPDNKPIPNEDRASLTIIEENKLFNKASKILEPRIGALFYRVRKSELALKPQIFHKPNLINMNKYERIIYTAIQNKIRDYAKKDYLQNIEFVRKLRRGRMIRIRQCLSYTKLLFTAIDDYDEELISDNNLKKIIYNYDNLEKPYKLKKLCDLVTNLQRQNQKVVIWANFIGTIKLIEKTLNNYGYYCKKIIGATPIERTSLKDEETREKIRDEFISFDSGLNILIANPAACAESISLHKTCYNAIYYDLSYNCAQYLQSLDRIHRVGGSEKNEANYHFLQYKDTIDPDILNNLNLKAQKMYNIIDDDYNIYSLDMFNDNDELEAYKKLFLK